MLKPVLLGLLVSAPVYADTNLIGGREVDKKDYPATVYSSQGNSRCTSTVIGKRTVLTAAHCVGNGGTLTFTDLQGKKYTSKCTHSPDYRGNSTADWALCLMTEDASMPAEVLNQDESLVKVGDEVLLSGYGCVRSGGGGGNDGKLRAGEAKVTQVPSGRSNDIVTKASAALCYGDSGGPSFKVTGEKRVVLAVNSRGNISTTSYLSSISTPSAKSFITKWADTNGQKICGVHMDAEGCRGVDPGPQPKPLPADCRVSLDHVTQCLYGSPRLALSEPEKCQKSVDKVAECELLAEEME